MMNLKKLPAFLKRFASLFLVRLPNRVIICLSVDCDIRPGPALGSGHDWLFDIFEKKGLQGNITYFINEKYRYTEDHPQVLERILKNKDRAELHTHCERKINAGDYEGVLSEISSEKDELLDFIRKYDPSYDFACFRSGTHAQGPALFRALKELNIPNDSSLVHEWQRNIYGKDTDNRDIPANCYWLGEKNLLEIPCWNHLPNMFSIKRGINSDEPVIITTLIHPFNVRSGRKNILRRLFYLFCLWSLKRIKGAQFTTMDKAAAAWRSWDTTSKS